VRERRDGQPGLSAGDCIYASDRLNSAAGIFRSKDARSAHGICARAAFILIAGFSRYGLSGTPLACTLRMTEVDFSQITAYQRYKLDGQPHRAAADCAGHQHERSGRGERRTVFDVQHAGAARRRSVLGINRLQDGQLKDTAANILSEREFVVHMTDGASGRPDARLRPSLPRPSVSELDAVGLHAAPSHMRAPAAHCGGAGGL